MPLPNYHFFTPKSSLLVIACMYLLTNHRPHWIILLILNPTTAQFTACNTFYKVHTPPSLTLGGIFLRHTALAITSVASFPAIHIWVFTCTKWILTCTPIQVPTISTTSFKSAVGALPCPPIFSHRPYRRNRRC